VREGGWFREELYARFRILGDTGTWEGRPPLAQLERQAA
jgi:spheroidene monooxygenase